MISLHAKIRAFERYGISFSKKRWEAFELAISNPKYSIRLQDERLACYFERQWFLLICNGNGVVLTFLSPEDITDVDKQTLRNDERYRRINNDTFRVLERTCVINTETQEIRPKKRSTHLPRTLPEDELPRSVLESAEIIMRKLCEK
ncbi:MAG: hypothetical protein ACRC2T_04925 [Thermoguttaceae bacterium]